MEYVIYLAYILVGIIAGVLAGLLGISGGVITVPALFFIFKFIDLPQPYLMHLSIGTSLAAMIFNAISSTWSHHQKGAVLWNLVRRMAPGIILGSILGAILAYFLPSVFLEMLFGVFAIGVGIYFFMKAKKSHPPDVSAKLPSKPIFGAINLGIGAISNILGIGGGIITVPILILFRIPEKKSIATSAATGFLITFIGAISYLIVGLNTLDAKGCIGYIYLPAFAMISIFSCVTAPVGARLAHSLSANFLKKIFGMVLFFTGLSMLF